MHVAFSGDNTTLRCLLEFQASVSALDADGRDALVYAAFNGHHDNVASLLDIRSRQGESWRIQGGSENIDVLTQGPQGAKTPDFVTPSCADSSNEPSLVFSPGQDEGTDPGALRRRHGRALRGDSWTRGGLAQALSPPYWS